MSRRDNTKKIFGRTIDFPLPVPADALAGLSVALVVIPQSLAYAQIAGMPLHIGLFASALPAVVFSLFASSPYLQTGPVAMTSLLTFGALSSAGFVAGGAEYVLAGAMLAVLVGVIRLICGVARFGWVAYLISDPVMIGFTSGAAIVIMASQLPKSVGSSDLLPDDGGTVQDALWTLQRPSLWSTSALMLTLATAGVMIGGRLMHRLFPGVLLAVAIGLASTKWLGYEGPTVGQPGVDGDRVGIPEGLPNVSLDLPWGDIPSLIVGALVIAFVGFAEPSSIARIFANEDRTVWNPNRELFSSGLANITAGLSGAYPVGGSFSRSSVNRLAGARTRWSGGITGFIVLVFLVFASVLEDLPLAVLGGIVLAAVYRLVKPKLLLGMWRRSPLQAGLALVTFVATIGATPNVHWAVAIGVGLSVVLHLVWPLSMKSVEVEADDGQSLLTITPVGMVWFATQDRFKTGLLDEVNRSDADEVVVDLSGVVAVDVTTMKAIGKVAVASQPRPLSVVGAPEGSASKIADTVTHSVDKHNKILSA